ncbi:MAG: hypothetical protein SFW67_12460 [Myxococcaceae bacterium]|nr:hypothetical protein [Myxococcaceae bacterium]
MVIELAAALVMGGAPKGLVDAELVTWAPKLAEVNTLLPFFTRAGEGSVMLAPASWRESAHPIVPFDVTRPESVTAVGIDVTQGLTLSTRGPVSVACHGVSDVKVFEAACRARLDRYGPVTKEERGGVTTLLSRDALNRVQGAVVLKGAEACAVHASGQTVEKLLPDVVKALTGKPLAGAWVKASTDLSAAQYFLLPEAANVRLPGWTTTALSAKGETLTVDVKAKGLPLATLERGGPSPFATLSAPGVLVLRVRVARKQLPALVEQVLSRSPFGKPLTSAGERIAPFLTGNVALVFSRVSVKSGLRSALNRFFAARFTVVAETDDATAAAEVVQSLDRKALTFREDALEAGITGRVVWLSNDVESRDTTLAALAKAEGTQRHGAELDVDPRGLARALTSVPLLEVVQTPELAPVLVVATELGPLLSLTDKIRGWADGAPANQRAQLTWVLSPKPRSAPDAGAP